MLCDSHISHVTLFPFADVQKKINSLKILAFKIHDDAQLKIYVEKFKKEHNISVEIKTSDKVHDRYLLAGENCWSIGASIKDLGNKDTMIREVNDMKHSLTELFKERWNEGTPWP